ncbi:hypothetical protein SMD11_7004 [Streptomyces albireticuli]|uniref:Uncharacterized protein n=1 Tax=Streptomyces albireticuli TaxID=1940 RepID=A0A1Z2LE34_9ACTN|nr:hypothetical protein SMD11_7004 [Streptomyces albireticuli]
MRVDNQGSQVMVTMSREEFSLVQSLMSEAVETGDDCDFQTRVGAGKDEVRTLLNTLPDLPFSPSGLGG